MLVVTPDPKADALPDVLLLGEVACRGVMDAHVQQVYASCVLTVITPHVGAVPVGFEDHGDAVQFSMAGVEDVAAHTLDRRAAIPVERASEI